MTIEQIAYKIVQHESGWAYRANGTFSEVYATQKLASTAAKKAAHEQKQPGEDVDITYEDPTGHWHQELSAGDDRPIAIVDK